MANRHPFQTGLTVSEAMQLLFTIRLDTAPTFALLSCAYELNEYWKGIIASFHEIRALMRTHSATVPEVDTEEMEAAISKIVEARSALVMALNAANSLDQGAAIHAAQCARFLASVAEDVPALFQDLQLRMQQRDVALGILPRAESPHMSRG